jgi:hypothetical protein
MTQTEVAQFSRRVAQFYSVANSLAANLFLLVRLTPPRIRRAEAHRRLFVNQRFGTTAAMKTDCVNRCFFSNTDASVSHTPIRFAKFTPNRNES